MSICGIEALRVGRVGSIREHLTVADSLLSDAVRCSQVLPALPAQKGAHQTGAHTGANLDAHLYAQLQRYQLSYQLCSLCVYAILQSCFVARWQDRIGAEVPGAN